MTRKTIHVLVAVITGLVLLLFVLRSDDLDDTVVSGAPWLPDFGAVANDIDKLRLSRPSGEEGITIHKDGDAWVVSARDDYPADFGKLRQLIIALANAEVLEEKTSNPDQYAKLGVGDPEDGGKGTKIVVSGPDFSYSVIIGNRAQGKYRYARLADHATSYLIDQDPEIPESVAGWLMPDIIDVDAGQVQRVSISHADGETIVVEKTDQEQTDFDVVEIPEGRELSYATVANGIAGALSGLELTEVRARIDAAPAATVICETWEGLTVSAEVVAEEDSHWVAFSAETTSEDATMSERVADINARVTGWQYQLQDHKKNLLIRRWDDILKTADDD